MSSIFGYDIVLSIKEAAIQSQLQMLYDTTLGAKLLPKLDPTGNTPLKKPKQHYLIDHDLLVKESESIVLDGHILCPALQLGPGGNQQARLEFTLRKDAGTSSILKYEDGSEKKTLSVDGYKVSWMCDIVHKQIQNVMEQLINPSKQPIDVNPVVLEPTVQQKLENAVLSSKGLMVSTLFCAFESSVLASSLKVKGSSGEEIAGPVYAAFKKLLMRHVDSLKSESPAGIPTIRNPFILGYGIIQTPAQLKQGSTATPSAFVPRKFTISITPAQGPQEPILNYLIETNQEPSPAATSSAGLGWASFVPKQEPSQATTTSTPLPGINDKAGGWATVTITRTPPADLGEQVRRLMSKSDGFAGVMAFSRELLLQEIVAKKFALEFFNTMDYNSVTNLDFLNYGTHTDVQSSSNTTGKQTGNTSYSVKNEFEKTFKTHENSWFFGLAVNNGEQKITGKAEVNATVKSDPASSKADGTHRLFLTFDPSFTYRYETSIYASGGSSSSWGQVSLKFRLVIIVSTGEDGRWFFELGDSVLPTISNGRLDLRSEDANGRLGAFAWGGGSSVAYSGSSMGGMSTTHYSNVVSHLPDLEKLSNSSVKSLVSKYQGLASSLNDMILMPAGDVYTFNGLDCSDEGHAFARLKYRTRTSGSRV